MTAPENGSLATASIAALRQVSTATLTSQLRKHGIDNTFLAGLSPLRPDLRMVGRALTLRYVPARADLVDELYDNTTNVQRLAVEEIGDGEVLVIDARGETGAAGLGHILGTRIRQRGAAGLVIDGALRDTPSFRQLDLPTYIRAPHATTSFAIHHPVEFNVPVACAEVAVLPGDVIVGDAEGALVIPYTLVDEIAPAALEQERLESFLLRKVRGGSSISGVYPPDQNTLDEYETWLAAGNKDEASN